jgi:hypothetical protein
MSHPIIPKVKALVDEIIRTLDDAILGLRSHDYFGIRSYGEDETFRIKLLESKGFTFLGFGAARAAWLLTLDGAQYVVKFDRISSWELENEHRYGQELSEPESIRNLADWVNQSELLKHYPQLARNIAVILGGFDCAAGLVLVQEYAPVNKEHNILSRREESFGKFLDMINQLSRDVMDNCSNYAIVNGEIKVIDLDRLSYKRLTSPRASAAVRNYYANVE